MNDVKMARKYISKEFNAKEAGIEFNLSFAEFKRAMNKKYCAYSGLELTEKQGFRKRTIDRIDNSKGYIAGNIIVCAMGINSLKGDIENSYSCLDLKVLEKTVKNFKKYMN